MRKLFLASVAASAISLSGCATFQATTATIVADTILIAKAACGFEPTVKVVTDIVKAAVPFLATAEAIAAAICQQITSLAASPGAVPQVAGVVLHGRFVPGWHK